MFVPKALLELFTISKETVEKLREDLTTTRTERDLLKSQLATVNANFSWLTLRVNALEVERAQLIDKAYGIKVPVPEIVRTSPSNIDLNDFGHLFEHIDDEDEKKLNTAKLS